MVCAPARASMPWSGAIRNGPAVTTGSVAQPAPGTPAFPSAMRPSRTLRQRCRDRSQECAAAPRPRRRAWPYGSSRCGVISANCHRVQWPTAGTRPVRLRAHRTGAALPIPPPWRHQPQRHPVHTARPGDRAPRSDPGHGPNARGCPCPTAGHRSHPIAAADARTRMPEPGCRRQPPRAWHRSRAGGVAVSRSSAPDQTLRSQCPTGTRPTRSAATPSATSCAVSGNATERSRNIRHSPRSTC
jgi:hypothetical protein